MYINNNILNYKNKKLILVLKKVYGLNKQQNKYILNTYKRYRHKNKLPIHGQNTHSNGKTAKKLNS